MTVDFFDEFRKNLEREPDRVAFLSLTGDKRETFTYKRIDSEVRVISRYLQREDLAEGKSIGILMENHPRWGIAFLAGQSAGATLVPLDNLHTPETLAYLISHAECQLLFCSEKNLPALEEIQTILDAPIHVILIGNSGGKYLEWDQILNEEECEGIALPLVKRDMDAPLILMYTSGTTGDPKGVLLSERSILRNVYEALNRIEIRPDDHFLGVLPLYHILALMVNFIVPLYVGAQVTFLDVIDAQRILQTCKKEGVTIFICVPQLFYLIHRKITSEVSRQGWFKRFVFRRLLRFSGFCNKRLGINPGRKLFPAVHAPFGGHMRLFGVGGARFDKEIAASLTDLGFNFIQAYGMTETAAVATVTRPGTAREGSVGQVLPNTTVRIDRPGEDGIGEVLIRGESLMKGYHKNPEATAETIDEEGWLHSGDLGYLDESGSLFITGRKKDVIVLSSGKNIFPEEIEHYYQSNCPLIKEMCVLGLSDDKAEVGREKLHAVIVPDFEQLKQDGVVNVYDMIRYLLETLSQKLPSHKRVLSFDIRQEPLPRTTTRKIKRFEVEEQLKSGVELADSESEEWVPEGRIAETVVEAIRKIKKNARVRPEMNLELDIGFESLERVELFSNVQESLGVEILDEEAPEIFTVQDLMELLGQKRSSGEVGPDQRSMSWDEILKEPLNEEDDVMVHERLRRRPFVEFLFILTTKAAWILSRILFRLKGEGLENLPRDYPFMICPNHLSFLDAFVVAALLPSRVIRRFFSLGYSDYFESGLTSFLGRLVKTIPVDADRRLRQALRLAAEGLKDDLVLCVFPEGERSIDGELKTFRRGPAILATTMKLPVVPVAIIGSYEAWRRGSSQIRLHPIRIRFGVPIQPEKGESIDEFNGRLYRAVEDLL